MTYNKNIPDDGDLVLVKDHIDGIPEELKYAVADNFTGKVIYNYNDAYLRYSTVKKLKEAQKIFREKGLGLKIWDAYRTVEAQRVMWEAYPDDDFVADPNKGFSNHNRGTAVDVTLIDVKGNELNMPTGFDDFEAMGKYDYNDEKNKEQTENANMLNEVMIKCGFRRSTTEWWHFNDTIKHPVVEDFKG